MARSTARAPAEQRRAQILEAAQTCFTESGYHETTVDDIAARCKLSKGSIYWHFPGKRELFLALFDRYIETLAEGLSAAGEPETAAAGLRQWSEVALSSGDPVDLAELMFEYTAHASRDEELRDRFRQMYAAVIGYVRGQIERGVADGSFRAVDPDSIARILFSLGDGLLIQKLAFPDLDLLGLVREAVDLVLRGIEVEVHEDDRKRGDES